MADNWSLRARRALVTTRRTARNPRAAYRVLRDHYHRDPNNPALRFHEAISGLTGLDVDLSFERSGVRWTIAPGRDLLGDELFTTGRYGGRDIDAMLRFVASERPGRSVVVDVGANIGTTTVPFALAGFQVIAIEPVPRTLRYLRANVTDNGLDDRVRIVGAAVAAERRTIDIAVSTSLGNSEVLEHPDATPGFFGRFGHAETVSVPTVSLDEVTGDVPPDSIALVWSDTQGFEAEVIASGTTLWRAGVPLFAEFSPMHLDVHGGLDHFVGLAGEHFAGFIPSDDLAEDARTPQPIGGLTDMARALRAIAPNEFTDVLLIPR